MPFATKIQAPGIKALISSGYANDTVVARFREHGFDGVLMKPYDFESLGRSLTEVMGR